MSQPAASEIIQSNPGDSVILEQLGRTLAEGHLRPRLIGPDDDPIEIPESLYRVLRDAVAILRAGDAVSISPVERRLTTTEAGDILGVSRQYLTRLIENHEIPCELIGRHRRIKLQDVLEYKAIRRRKRLEALRKLTAEDAALGEYN